MSILNLELTVRSIGRRLKKLVYGYTPTVLEYNADNTGTSDSFSAFVSALSENPHVLVPTGVYRVSGTIVLEANKTLELAPGTRIVRDVGAGDGPTVWVKGSLSTLVGKGYSSHIDTETRASTGVVLVGHSAFSAAASSFTSTYTNVRNLRITGMQRYGQSTGLPDSCVYIPNWQNSGNASYFHNLSNLYLGSANKGIWLHGWANANIIDRIHTIHIGDVHLHVHGALDNIVQGWFAHQSADSTVLRLENLDNTGAGGNNHQVVYNQLNLGGEPGGLSKSLEIVGGSAGITGNQVYVMGNNAGGTGGTLDALFMSNNNGTIGRHHFSAQSTEYLNKVGGVSTKLSSSGAAVSKDVPIRLDNLTEGVYYKLVDLTSLSQNDHAIVEVRGTVARGGLPQTGTLYARYAVRYNSSGLTVELLEHTYPAGSTPRMAEAFVSGSTVTIGFRHTNNGTSTTNGFAAFLVSVVGVNVDSGFNVVSYDQNPTPFSGVSANLADKDAATYKVNGVQVLTAQQSAVPDATGGTTVDTEARAAINSLLAKLRTHGVIST